MRPIVSAVGSPCYRLAKELARILTPLAGLNGYTVRNSVSFVETVKELQMSPQDHLVSFNVTNLFTQVPVTEALAVIEEKLAGDQSLGSRTSIPVPPPGGTRGALPTIVLPPIRRLFLRADWRCGNGLPSFAHRCESVPGAPRRRSYSIITTPSQTVASLRG